MTVTGHHHHSVTVLQQDDRDLSLSHSDVILLHSFTFSKFREEINELTNTTPCELKIDGVVKKLTSLEFCLQPPYLNSMKLSLVAMPHLL